MFYKILSFVNNEEANKDSTIDVTTCVFSSKKCSYSFSFRKSLTITVKSTTISCLTIYFSW